VPSILDVAAVRLRNHRLLRTGLRDPVSVVHRLGAVQSQDYPSAKWGVGLRGTGFSDADVDEAFNRGGILRTHVLRPTWHFVLPADIRWMLALTAPRVHAVCASYYRKMEIDRPLFARSARAIERALRGGKALTRSELAAALGRAGIEARLQRLAFFMIHAELEGLVCSGPRRGTEFTYALLEERVPPVAPRSKDESLAELTRRYFASHGPATLRDCSWWSGLPMREIKRGLEMLGSDVSSASIDGLTCWFIEAPRARGTTVASAHLLPIYDEFLIAYQDRGFVVRGSAAPSIYSGRDADSHHLIVDGRLAGRWRRTGKAGAFSLDIETYRRLNRSETAAVRSAVDQHGAFIDAPVTASVTTARRLP
jgi:hypothetical protein